MDEIKKLLAALMAAIEKLPGDTAPADVVVEDGDDTDTGATTTTTTDGDDTDTGATTTTTTDGDDTDTGATTTTTTDGDDTDTGATTTTTTDGDDTDKPVTTAVMDAAVNSRVMQQFEALKRGAALAAKLKPHTGVFDHSGKTEAQIAAYGVKKLGLTVGKGQEIPTLKGYLIAKGDPSKDETVRNRSVAAMDSADKTPSLMAKKLAERSKA